MGRSVRHPRQSPNPVPQRLLVYTAMAMTVKRESLFGHEPLTCPKCGERIAGRQLRKWQCPSCHIPVTVADSYARLTGLLAVAIVITLGILTHRTNSDGTWLLCLILSVIPIRFVLSMIIPPWLKKGRYEFRFTFGEAIITSAIYIFLVLFVLGAGTILLLGSKNDVRELLEALSAPIVWINRNFLITPDKNFLDVCGVILGNSFFYGSFYFVCQRCVRCAYRKARPIRLSLSGKDPTDDD